MQAGSIVGGKYRLTREIGQGSMGTVWAAVHELLGREVAIKFLSPSFEDPRTSAARFVAEAKAAAQVKHRFVVDVFDFGITEAGGSYMVQEFLSGEPLSDVMYHGPHWSLAEAARFMEDCLSGLSAVHERGIVHRDLKPENIFVVGDSEGRTPKLLDFGISKAAELPSPRVPRPSIRSPQMKRLTAAGATLGTPAYMSPEQLRNLSSLDARADVYSMGVVFYEWLAGHCPFASTMNFAELLDRILQRAMTPLVALRPELGEELCAVIARAIEPDREARFDSALAMRAALVALRGRLPDARTTVQKSFDADVGLVIPSLPPPPLRAIADAAERLPAPARLPRLADVPEPLRVLSWSPPAAIDEAHARADTESLRPAGLRRGPSARVWLAAAGLALAGLALPLALRTGGHAQPPTGTGEAAPAAARPSAGARVEPSQPGADRARADSIAAPGSEGAPPADTQALADEPHADSQAPVDEAVLPSGEAPPEPEPSVALSPAGKPGRAHGRVAARTLDGIAERAAQLGAHDPEPIAPHSSAPPVPASRPSAPADGTQAPTAPKADALVRSLDF